MKTRLSQHNSGYGSTSTAPVEFRPWALRAYVCGFNGDKNLLRTFEKIWQRYRDRKIQEGINCVDDSARGGANVIANIANGQIYNTERISIRLVLLFK